MKAYKGFNPDMACRGFQYEEGKTYKADEAILCKRGFHACLAPLDVFSYYSPCDDNGNLNKFHEVELEEVDEGRDNDTKVCAKKITIGAELNSFGLAKAHVEYVKEHVDKESVKEADGDQSAASATGNWSAASAMGDQSAASATGNLSVASATGTRSAASAEGQESVALAWGVDGKAKAALGSYIALAELGESENGYKLVCARMHKVDGKIIKPDTFYKLKGGKFVEVKE